MSTPRKHLGTDVTEGLGTCSPLGIWGARGYSGGRCLELMVGKIQEQIPPAPLSPAGAGGAKRWQRGQPSAALVQSSALFAVQAAMWGLLLPSRKLGLG